MPITLKDLQEAKRTLEKQLPVSLLYIIPMTPTKAVTFIPKVFGVECDLDERGQQLIGDYLITTKTDKE